jgi:hypothetical protein
MNDYLSEQVAATFPDAAARDSAIPAPTLGQPCYLTGLKVYQVWNGTTWANVAWAGGLPGAALHSVGTQSTAHGAVVGVTILSAVDHDQGGYTGTPNTLTIPTGHGGLFLITGQVSWVGGGTAGSGRDIYLNLGGTAFAQNRSANPGAFDQAITASALQRLAAGNAITLGAWQGSGVALNLVSTGVGCKLALVRLAD